MARAQQDAPNGGIGHASCILTNFRIDQRTSDRNAARVTPAPDLIRP